MKHSKRNIFVILISLCLYNFSFAEDSPASNEEGIQTNYQQAYTLLQEKHDLERALDLLDKAAHEENSDQSNALFTLGHLYQVGDIVERNYTKAIEYFNQSALIGNAEAYFELGFMYETGKGVEKNEPLALVYYTFSSLGESEAGMLTLAYKYNQGHGVPKSCSKAALRYEQVASRVAEVKDILNPFRNDVRLSDSVDPNKDKSKEENIVQYYQYSADTGDAAAQVTMGTLYLQGGLGVARDYDAAFRYFQQAADMGDAGGISNLGFMYAQGYGTEQNNQTAIQLYREAAEKGSALAQTNLGYMYMHGYGVPKSSSEAFKYFKLAADLGHSEGQVNLGSLYFNGEGVKQDYAKALSYFSYAAQHGHILGVFNLAQMHHHGLGTVPSCQMAVQMYKRVAERGPLGDIMSEAHDRYLLGDYEGALLRYEKAAVWGFEMGQANAAYMLDKGLGTEETMNETERYRAAFEYFRSSAEQKNAQSLLKIGDYYFDGLGIVQDLEKAAQLYQTASEMRSAQAMFNLGYMHHYGIGLPRDLHLAKRHYDWAVQTDVDSWLAVYLALGSVGYHFVLEWIQGNPRIAGMALDNFLITLLVGLLVFLLALRNAFIQRPVQI